MSHFVDESDIEKEIMNLNNSTTSQDSDIPVKIIRNNLDIFKHILCQELNRSIELSRFRRSFRQSTDKTNYRLIIILPKLSKKFQKDVFEKVLSIQQCGFRKCFSAQHGIIRLKEKWKLCLEQGSVFGVLITDLSKGFNFT